MSHKKSHRKPTEKYVQKPPIQELEHKTKDVKNPKDLPDNYLLVHENWMNKVEQWEEKLRKDGKQFRRPLTLYRYTHVVTTVDLCLEVVPVEV